MHAIKLLTKCLKKDYYKQIFMSTPRLHLREIVLTCQILLRVYNSRIGMFRFKNCPLPITDGFNISSHLRLFLYQFQRLSVLSDSGFNKWVHPGDITLSDFLFYWIILCYAWIDWLHLHRETPLYIVLTRWWWWWCIANITRYAPPCIRASWSYISACLFYMLWSLWNAYIRHAL